MGEFKLTEHEKACIEEQAGRPVDFENVTIVPYRAAPDAADRLYVAASRLLNELTQAYVTDEARAGLRAALITYERSKGQ